MEVSHIILRVGDMSEALEFYREVVGLQVAMEGPAFSFLDAGTIRIVLNQVAEVSADTTDTEIVIEVDDVRAAYESMQLRGVPFAVALRPVMSDGDRDLLAAHFRDPDGHLWSVTGWGDTKNHSSG
jgi:methylmalonyl-CoA/ethylmalonyl-CoA epimerase